MIRSAVVRRQAGAPAAGWAAPSGRTCGAPDSRMDASITFTPTPADAPARSAGAGAASMAAFAAGVDRALKDDGGGNDGEAPPPATGGIA